MTHPASRDTGGGSRGKRSHARGPGKLPLYLHDLVTSADGDAISLVGVSGTIQVNLRPILTRVYQGYQGHFLHDIITSVDGDSISFMTIITRITLLISRWLISLSCC